MPYNNLPESQWDEMDRCVESVMADGKDKETAIAICFASISGKSAYMRENADIVYLGGEVKALGNGKVGGYLVRYSSPNDPDLTNDFFSKSSNIRVSDTVPVLYDHGMDKILQDREIGQAQVKKDDVGIWVEAQLNLRDQYEKAVYKLAESGKLGWSSGAISHLVKREPAGKAMHIKSWWIGEASLTPTPAEFRNSVTTIKNLQQFENAISVQEKNTMTENVDVKSIVEAEVKAALEAKAAADKAEADRLAAIKKAEEDGYNKAIEELKSRKAPAYNRNTELGFSEEKDAVPAFKHWLKTGQVNGGLISPDASFNIPEAKAAWNVTTGASGGYLVPDPLYAQIIAKRNLASWVRQAPVQRFSTPSDHLLVPVEDTSHTAFVKTAEAAAYDENEGTVAQKDLILYKYTKMQKVSEEFINYQGTNFDAWLAEALGRAESVTENTIYTTGSGTSEPQGVLTGATNSSLTLAAVDTIAPAEMSALIGKLGAGYNVPAECGWLMANATKWYLKGLTSNNFTFVSTPQGADFFGYTSYTSDDMAPYTTESDKPLLFGNFSFYGIVEKPGMIVQRNPYLYMANGQIGIFASIFRGGAVLQSEAFYYINSHA